MVELAFSLVVLMVLAAGAMDLGRAFFAYMALRDAAQEGAVFGSICPADKVTKQFDTTKIFQRVRLSSTNPIDLSDTTHVQIACFYLTGGTEVACSGPAAPGDGIKIQVSYDNFPITTPFLGAFLGTQTLNLRAEVTDTILRDTCP